MIIGIIVAMSKEMEQLRKLLNDTREETHGKNTFVVGKMGDNTVVLLQCGIGKVNAAIGAVELINGYGPDAVVSTGCAGGTRVAMQAGDVVVATETVYHDVSCFDDNKYGQIQGLPERFAADPTLVAKARLVDEHLKAKSHDDAAIKLHFGLIASGDWFVCTKGKAGSIVDFFPEALAIDMESCAIAHTCHVYGVPFISFRVVSDVPLNDTHASQYYDFWDRMANGSFTITRDFLETI